jgi:hypothetical protein
MTTSDNLKSAQELTASKRALDRAIGVTGESLHSFIAGEPTVARV